ncbi:amidase family protein [Streptomyces sp. HG99]|uniref:amidase family protein n=1 Tax=Streptomyces sp. HG99 TaxID=1958787 RepID=UPI001F0BB367|nr:MULTISPECIES: amidase family protein [Streptomyces]
MRDFDRALSAARDADEARAKGARQPHLGVPMTVKESFNVRGVAHDLGHSCVRGLHGDRGHRGSLPSQGGQRGDPRQDEFDALPHVG